MGIFLAQLLFGGDDPNEHCYVYSTHGESRARDLQFRLDMTPEGRFKLKMQEFLTRVEKGNQVIILDEANMRPEMLWALSAIARGDKEISVEIPGEEERRVRIGGNVHILLTMNPESYSERGIIPDILLEDIFRQWAPVDYESDELTAILTDLAVAHEEYAGEVDMYLLRAQLMLDNTAYKLTDEMVIQAVRKHGKDRWAAALIKGGKTTEDEIKELESEMLARPDIRKKTEFIRTKMAISSPQTTVTFSLTKWWSTTMDHKVINVPLYELINPERSVDAVIGLIIHETRHTRFSLTQREIEEALAELGVVDVSGLKDFHRVLNYMDDLRIDLMPVPRLGGEDDYIRAMNSEMFARAYSDEEKGWLTKTADVCPQAALMNYILSYTYSAYYGFDARLDSLDDLRQGFSPNLRDAIRTLVEGGTASRVYAAVQANLVKPDFGEVAAGRADRNSERRRAAKESLRIIFEQIYPVYANLFKPGQPDPGAGGMSGGPDDGMSDATGGGKPRFELISDEQGQALVEGQTEGARKPGEPKPGEPRPGEPKPGEGKPGAPKPGEPKPGEPKPGEPKPGEPKPGEPKPGEPKPGEPKPGEPKPGEPKPGEPTFMDSRERKSRARNLQSLVAKGRQQRLEQMQASEPLNYMLSQVSAYGKRLGKGLIHIFRVPDEPDIEESATGWRINPVRYITRHPEPFDVDVDLLGKPDLALGVTVDTSGSMARYKPAIERMLAIFMSTFQEIGKKKADYSVSYVTSVYDEGIKPFDEQLGAQDMNGRFAAMVNVLRKGGRIDPGNGIDVYGTICGIIEKHKKTHRKNKVEVVITDGDDIGHLMDDGMFHKHVIKEADGSRRASAELQKKLDEARRMGVEIIGIGFNTRDTEVFGKYIQLDTARSELVVEALLKIARYKVMRGVLPAGNLAQELSLNLSRMQRTVARTMAAEPAAAPAAQKMDADAAPAGEAPRETPRADGPGDRMARSHRQTVTELFKSAMDMSMRNLFDGQPVIVNIPIDRTLSGMDDNAAAGSAAYREAVLLRGVIENLFRMSNLANVTVNFFENTKEGRNRLLDDIDAKTGDWGVSDEERRQRVITFMFDTDDITPEEKEGISDRSFQVLMSGEKVKGEKITPTPIAACSAAALDLFNVFDMMRPGRAVGMPEDRIDAALRRAADSLSGISGALTSDLADAFYKAFKDSIARGLAEGRTALAGLLSLSGKLFVPVGPIDWNGLAQFYKREREILTAL
ncbi:MAG: hypothetical protein ABH885_05265 [Candidatus Omnitrophota bacterium]